MNKKIQSPVNQRFELFLFNEKISAREFARNTGMTPQTVINISNGTTANPKSDFFIAVATHYPKLNLRWLLLEEGEMYLSEGAAKKVMEISKGERAKLMSIIGEKDVQLLDAGKAMEEAYEVFVEVAAFLDELEIVEENREKWAPLKKAFGDALGKLNAG